MFAQRPCPFQISALPCVPCCLHKGTIGSVGFSTLPTGTRGQEFSFDILVQSIQDEIGQDRAEP